LGLGALLFEHAASKRLAADVFLDRLGKEQRGRFHGPCRGEDQLILPHLDIALNLREPGLLEFVLTFGFRLDEPLDSGQIFVVVFELGAGWSRPAPRPLSPNSEST